MEQVEFEKNIQVEQKDALIIVDMQNDFIPGGSLPVEEGDLIIRDINMINSIIVSQAQNNNLEPSGG